MICACACTEEAAGLLEIRGLGWQSDSKNIPRRSPTCSNASLRYRIMLTYTKAQTNAGIHECFARLMLAWANALLLRLKRSKFLIRPAGGARCARPFVSVWGLGFRVSGLGFRSKMCEAFS